MLNVNLHHHNSFFWIISCIGSPTAIIEYREQSPSLSWALPQTTDKPTQPISCEHSGKESPKCSRLLSWIRHGWEKRAVARPLKMPDILSGGLRAVVTQCFQHQWWQLFSTSHYVQLLSRAKPDKAEDVTLHVLYLACNLNAFFLPHAVILN